MSTLFLRPDAGTVTHRPEEHEYFGCTWKRALSRGVWICMYPTCVKQAFCPGCVPGQQPIPGKIVVHYCREHRKEVTG